MVLHPVANGFGKLWILYILYSVHLELYFRQSHIVIQFSSLSPPSSSSEINSEGQTCSTLRHCRIVLENRAPSLSFSSQFFTALRHSRQVDPREERTLHGPEIGAQEVVLNWCIPCHWVGNSTGWHWMPWIKTTSGAPIAIKLIILLDDIGCHESKQSLVLQYPCCASALTKPDGMLSNISCLRDTMETYTT